MIKRILLALGGAPFSAETVRRGIELAKAHGAKLTAVTILDTEYWKLSTRVWMTAGEAAEIAASKPWLAVEQRVKRVVHDFETACRKADVPCETICPQRKPFQALASEARYSDLTIFGLQSMFAISLVPEVEQAVAQLIRGGVRPLLAVTQEPRPIRRVLITYNGSIESAKTMRQFIQMKLWPQVSLALAVFQQDTVAPDKLLTDAVAYCRAHGHDVDAQVVAGSAHDALLPHARDADLIVAGDSFRNVILRDLLGDTMSHMVRQTDKPLFISH